VFVLCEFKGVVLPKIFLIKAYLIHASNNLFSKEKHFMKKFSVVLLCAIFAATSFFSCKQPAKDDEKPKPVEIASIKVDPSSITLNKGETSTLKATITPSNAPQEVKWESDAPEKVSVDASGKITAKDIGTANVKVTSLKDFTKSATCVVTVVKPVVAIDVKVQMPDGFVEVTQVLPEAGIPYTATHTDCNIAGKFILKASVKDEKLKDKTIVGKVSKLEATPTLPLKAVAKNTFELTFSKVETSTPYTLTFSIDEEAKKEISLNLLPEPEITKIECEISEITLGKNFTYQIKEPKLTYEPSKIGSANAESFVLNATKKITYTSNNDTVATVNESGEVQTKAPGEAIISMETTNGKKATLKITVENQVSPNKLNLSHEYINLKVRETKDITISPEPSNGSLLITDWTNSNASVGKIEKKSANTYTVTALSKGETTFEATSKFNPNVKLAIHLTVSDKLVMSVKIEPARLTIEKDETKSLTATITPAEAPQKVRWESNKPETVSVDENGNITAKDFGVAVIKAISLADSTKTGTCLVTVAAPVGSVKLNKELLELKYNESFALTATIEPATAPKEVTWSCDDEAILTYTSAGVITAKNKAGKATITATSQSDPSKKAHCVVYVAGAKVASIKLSEDSFEMDTNGEKDFTVEVLPSSSTADLDYEIEGENLTLKKFEKTGSYYENKYSCTVKSGNLEETKKITFWSKANPAIKAILNITTTAPKVQSVTVEDKTISLDNTMTEKMTAVVLPSNAVQTVKWMSKDTNVVMIDESSGQLTPIKVGQATIVATSTADPTKKAEAKVTVKASVTSFDVAVNKSYIHFGGDVATLTVTPVPADAFGDFICETECEDLSIAKVDGNDNAFTIKVKNKSAKTAEATLKVKSKAVTNLAEKTETIRIATIIPKTISIQGDDKMYLSEELQFTINATTEHYSDPEPDKSVKWEFDKSYTGSNKLNYYDVDVKEDGKVKLRSASWDDPGKSFRIKATSLLDESIVATKVITICKDVAKITSVSCDETEWTHCKEANTSVYNGMGGLFVSIGLEGYSNEHIVYKKFVVSEQSSPYTAEHNSRYLAKTLYESITSSSTSVKLSTKSHTYGKAKKFYVWPIDPKTDRPITTGEAHTFDLLIWAEPEGIEFYTDNFTISKLGDGGYQSNTLLHGSNNRYFYARITPQYANQNLLTYTTENLSKYMCILNDKKADDQDREGWTKYRFDVNSQNQYLDDERAKFNFEVKVGDKSPKPAIKQYLLIISD